MSKRGSIFAQGKAENPYDERDDSPADLPRKATAAQLAGRKLKTAKGIKRPPGVTSGLGLSASQPTGFGGSQQPSGFGFGGTNNNPSNANPFGGLSQSQPPIQNGNGFGNGMNSFPPAQSSAPSNAFSSSSFPSFGGNATNTVFNPQPPATGFNFPAAASNPFAASAPAPAPAPAMNGSGGFGGSVFGASTSQAQPQAPANPFNLSQNTAPAPNNPFGSIGTGAQNSNAMSAPNPSALFPSVAAATPNNSSTTNAPNNAFGFMQTSAPISVAPSNPPASTPFVSIFPASSSAFPAVHTATTAQTDSSTTTTTPSGFSFGGGTAAVPKDTSSASSGFSFLGASTSAVSKDASASTGGFNSLNASTAAAPKGTSVSPGGFSFPTSNTTAVAKNAPASSGAFNFGGSTTAPSQNTPASSSDLNLGTDGTAAAKDTPASSGSFTFLNTSAAAAPKDTTTPLGGLNFGTTAASTTKDKPASSGSFNILGASNVAKSTPAATGNSFMGFGTDTPTSKPAPITSGWSFGSGNKEATATPASKPFASSLFNGAASTFQTNNAAAPSSTNTQDKDTFPSATPQTTKAQESSGFKSPFGQPKHSTAGASEAPKEQGLFPQPSPFSSSAFSSKKPESSQAQGFSLFTKQSNNRSSHADAAPKHAFTFPPPTPSSTASTEVPKPDPSHALTSSASPSKDGAPPSPASAMPTLTGAGAPPSKAAETAIIPRIHAGQNWSSSTDASQNLAELSEQLALVNDQYRTKLAGLPLTADWTSLSRWHLKETSDILKQITVAKKQIAATKGITGNESSLSVKRKPDEEVVRHAREGSPTKKHRSGDAPSTPTPKTSALSSTTPKANPPASQTSSLFANSISKGSPSSSGEPEKKQSEASKTSGFQSPFGNSNTTNTSKKNTFESPFQIPKSASSKSGFQIPGASSTKGSGGAVDFMAQFGSTSKTAEQMRAERKAKAKDADYDSDEETEEAWSARWDKEEAERVAKEKEKLKETVTPALKVTAPAKAASDATSTSNMFGSVGGTSSPGFFGSRSGSPALSNAGGNSVFDTPGATTPTQNNIFGHLSSAPSSNNHEDDDDDDDEQDQAEDDQAKDNQAEDDQSESQPEQSPDIAGTKRKHDESESESESEGTLEDMMRRKKQHTMTKKPSLLDRITKADPSEIETADFEKENDKPSAVASVSEQTNGQQTPTPKSFFFDFEAAGSKTAPSKQDTFVGDQTFKVGTPIKFGTAMKGTPGFQLHPATPSATDFSTTPSKWPPGTFDFLKFLDEGKKSGSGSAISSRAPTPISEAESGKDSAAENEEDGSKPEQLDLSKLTEEEKIQHDVLFSIDRALVQVHVEKNGKQSWEKYARGALWILKNKESGKAIVRLRIDSGATRLNYNILPKLKTKTSGSHNTMVTAMGAKEDGKMGKLCFQFKTAEAAKDFSQTYNENVS